MNIPDNDQEKSVMLARLCNIEGLEVGQVKGGNPYYYVRHWSHDKPMEFDINLYDPANMALAWRVLNWAQDQKFIMDDGCEYFLNLWWVGEKTFSLPPAEAQRAWLDKILELAIEAGMIEGERVE